MAVRTKPRRTVAPISISELPEAAVGSRLSSDTPTGLSTVEDDQLDQQDSSESQTERRLAFLDRARKRWRQSSDSESDVRRNMLDDLKFYNSDQWPDSIKMDRYLDGRPCLTINRLPQFVRQVLNQARQQRPAIQYSPVDNGADVDTAEILQGIARSIERASKASIAYNTAGEHQVIMGRGWLRVRADWITQASFDQEILIESFEDPFTVYPDPASQKLDGSDATFGFIIARVPWFEYKVKYPKASRASLLDWTSIGDDAPDWVNEFGVLVAEYYYLDEVKAELVESEVTLRAGMPPVKITTYRDMLRPQDLKPGPHGEPPKITILRSRETVKKQLKWALINGAEVLEGSDDKTEGRDLPGSIIPLVPMFGEKIVVNGRRNLRGMVRDAKDPQRTYNFWVSAETEMIALAPRAPVIGAVGQFETTKEQWLVANRRNFPFLEYDPIDINGNLVPAPQRNPYDPNVQPIIAAAQQADMDLKSVVGMFDASQEHSREQSGKAIIARQQQGEHGTSHFLANQALAIEQIGRILLQWIPIYYDQPRVVRIIGMDDREKEALVHAGNPDGAAEMQQQLQQHENPLLRTLATGAMYDLSLGRYDVAVSVAPSYQSRRAEAVDAMVQLLQAFPLAAPYALDVLVKNMDWPGARELSERFKHLVPPEARDEDDGKPPIPPEVQQQMQQMQEQLQMAGQQVEQLQQMIQTKQQELAMQGQIRQMEIASNERVAQMKAQLEIAKIDEKTKAEVKLTLLEGKLKELAATQEQLHERQMQLEKPQDVPAPTPPEPPPPPRPIYESLNYKDAPPDVRRQIEAQAGLTPSKQHDLEVKVLKEEAKPKPKPAPARPAAPKKPS
jgi:hypothetical protein